MTDKTLAELKALAEKAKDLTNSVKWNQGPHYRCDVMLGGGMHCTTYPFHSQAGFDVAAYIAAVDPTTVLSLIAELEAARQPKAAGTLAERIRALPTTGQLSAGMYGDVGAEWMQEKAAQLAGRGCGS